MRILELKFKNINNLKGETVIPFNKGILADAGIFAITGPTGSGKSTILDVITLALFNRIPRFSAKGITKAEIEGKGSVMTHHTNEASASITYKVKGQIYTSSWSVSKNRNNKLRDHDMVLYNQNGTPLDLKRSEVPKQNEIIIGLEYEQFIKSIILSQGEFAKFIKSKKDERVKLLENITGTYIYRKIGIKTYQKFKSVEKDYKVEQIRLDDIVFLSEEERMDILQSIKSKSKLQESLNSELGVQKEKLQVKVDLKKANSDLLVKKDFEKANTIALNDFKTNIDKLNRYEQLAPLIGDVSLYNDAVEHSKKHTKNLSNNEMLLKKAKDKLTDAIVEMATLSNQNVDANNFNVALSAFEKEINGLDAQLKNIEQNGIDARNRINIKAQKYSPKLDLKIAPNTALAFLEDNEIEILKSIANANLDRKVSKIKLKTILSDKIKVLEKLKELNHATSQLQHIEKEIVEDTNDKGKHEKTIIENTPLLNKTINQLKQVDEIIELLLKDREQKLLIAKLSDHRNDLVDGDACPLCGSLDHPYSEHLSNADKSDIENKITKHKVEKQNFEVEINKFKESISKANASIELISKRLDSSTRQLKEIEQTVLKLEAVINIDLKKQALDDHINQMQSDISALEDAYNALGLIEDNAELQNGYKELLDIYKSFKEIENHRNAIFIGKDVSITCNTLQEKFIRNSTQIIQLKTNIDNSTNGLAEAEKAVIAIRKKLMPQLNKYNVAHIEDVNQYILSQEEISHIKIKKENLNNSATEIATEIRTISETLVKLKEHDDNEESIDMLKEKIKKAENERDEAIKSLGECTNKIQRDNLDRERVKDKKQILDKLQTKLDKWSLLNKMIGDATGNKFANYAQGLTLQNLLVYANKRLTNLSDRYLLDLPKNDDGTLMVIDQYQGNIQRAVSTLSGGESFLISLSLALSLSDMASKNVQLESLFIDEGFGTLDQDTLDVAMNTLEKLQTESQKIVGVISHVETLKERINVQIKLDKNAQGYSTISVVN
ncbi:MAG: AAA family ATPase [Saprospiraceae bacterium]